MTEYIERGKVLAYLKEQREELLDQLHRSHIQGIKRGIEIAISAISDPNFFKAADVVSAEAYKQLMWERDTAIAQLAEYGVGFGEKKKDVEPVVRCKDCESSEKTGEAENPLFCECLDFCVSPNWFCASGSKRGAHMDERSTHED